MANGRCLKTTRIRGGWFSIRKLLFNHSNEFFRKKPKAQVMQRILRVTEGASSRITRQTFQIHARNEMWEQRDSPLFSIDREIDR